MSWKSRSATTGSAAVICFCVVSACAIASAIAQTHKIPQGHKTEIAGRYLSIGLEAGYARLGAPKRESGVALDLGDIFNSPSLFKDTPSSNGFRLGLSATVDPARLFGDTTNSDFQLTVYGSFARATHQNRDTSNATSGVLNLVAKFGQTAAIAFLGPLTSRLSTRLTDIEAGIRLQTPGFSIGKLQVRPYGVIAYNRFKQAYSYAVDRSGAAVSDQSDNLSSDSLLFGPGLKFRFAVTNRLNLTLGGAVLMDVAFAKLTASQTMLTPFGNFPPVLHLRYRETGKNIGYRGRFNAAVMYDTGRIHFGLQFQGEFRSFTPQTKYITKFSQILDQSKPLQLGSSATLNYALTAVLKVDF